MPVPTPHASLGRDPRRRRRGMVAAAVVVLLLAGGFCYWHRSTDARFHAVHAGVLYRCAGVAPDRIVGLCKQHGIRTVIDLRGQTPEESHSTIEGQALAAAGIRHIHLPARQVPSAQVVKRFLEVMDDPANHPVLVHCTHGRGRTGVMSALYRIEYQGWANEAARRHAQRRDGSRSFAPDQRKGEFLLEYVPRARLLRSRLPIR